MKLIKWLVVATLILAFRRPAHGEPSSSPHQGVPLLASADDGQVTRKTREYRGRILQTILATLLVAVLIHFGIALMINPGHPPALKDWISLISRLSMDPGPGSAALAATGISATIFFATAVRSQLPGSVGERARVRVLDFVARTTAGIVATTCWMIIPFALTTGGTFALPNGALILILATLNGSLPTLAHSDPSLTREQLARLDREINQLRTLRTHVPSSTESVEFRPPLRTLLASMAAGFLPVLTAAGVLNWRPNAFYWIIFGSLLVAVSFSTVYSTWEAASQVKRRDRILTSGNYFFLLFAFIFTGVGALTGNLILWTLWTLTPIAAKVAALLRYRSREMCNYRGAAINKRLAVLVDLRNGVADRLRSTTAREVLPHQLG